MNISNKLRTNSGDKKFLRVLQESIAECDKFYFSVAFVNLSGLQLLVDTLDKADQLRKPGKIITSTYLNFSDPKAIRKLKEFYNLEVKIFDETKGGFHSKVYVFEKEDSFKVIIGSANLTKSALTSNVEWNVEVVSKEDMPFIEDVMREYNALWDDSRDVNEEFLEQYELFWRKVKEQEKAQKEAFKFLDLQNVPEPNIMQAEAVATLDRFRKLGEKRALAVAATGTGKTFLAAFDVEKFKPKKLLFVVHRKEILEKAKETFEIFLKDTNIKTGLFAGSEKCENVDYVFAMVQTLNNNLETFSREAFDYIIIDEAHHATSPTYEKVIEYFKPEFLLGVTATPERSDSGNVFDLFDNNIAIDIRMREALEKKLIAPFHYFGITDIDAADLSDVSVDDVAEITRRLKVNERVDFVIEKMNLYGFDGIKRKCLGFCASLDHAQYMSAEFNKRRIVSHYLTGADNSEERMKYIKRLEDENDELEVLFTMDIFNEGVDIPSVNQVLMLRPTQSPIVFIQQLGRGLRKHVSKEFLTVLDFIGNHNRAYLVAIALNGSRFYDKESLMVAVKTGFANIPGEAHIQMDEIIQERILAQLESENFNSLKYLKEDYYEFKQVNGGKIPMFMLDYLKYESAPDPVRFVLSQKTYLDFLSKVERDANVKSFVTDENFDSVLKSMSSMLPLKRPHEFAVLNNLLEAEELQIEHAEKILEVYIGAGNNDTVLHAFETLNQQYLDSGQLKRNTKLVAFENGILRKSEVFSQLLSNIKNFEYIKDVIHYGLQRYQKEFGNENYGVPFFKKYEQYSMVDTALLSNYRKTHTSFRGSGLLTHGNDYFLFIDLHKEEGIKESINYKDKIIDKRHFQWQTPNATSQSSERGKNIIFNKERGINLHLFVRKFKDYDGLTQPYIYLGKANSIGHEGEKPITVQMRFEYELPDELYKELTVMV